MKLWNDIQQIESRRVPPMPGLDNFDEQFRAKSASNALP